MSPYFVTVKGMRIMMFQLAGFYYKSSGLTGWVRVQRFTGLRCRLVEV